MVAIGPRARDATGINSSGQVVGTTPGVRNSYLWTPAVPNGTVGSLVEFIFDPGGQMTVATKINSTGQFVGSFGSFFGSPNFHAFLWTPQSPNGTTGSMVELGYLPGHLASASALDISSMGQVVGSSMSEDILNPSTHAFLWTPAVPNGTTGSMIDLGDLPGGGEGSIANAVNSRGQVVGEGSTATGNHAFLWTPVSPNGTSGSMVDLGTLPGGFDRSIAHDINSHGQVVGESWVEGLRHAFLWTPDTPNGNTGVMEDLNSLLDPVSTARWTLQNASAINDAGQIVGHGIYDLDGTGTRRLRAFLLTPVPEPVTSLLLSLGLMLLAAERLGGRRIN
jgi:probable HAF family extracellular repeat protein